MSDSDLCGYVLWPFLNTIRHGSRKMDFIIAKIEEMQRDSEQHRDVADTRVILQKTKKMVIMVFLLLRPYRVYPAQRASRSTPDARPRPRRPIEAWDLICILLLPHGQGTSER